VSHADRARGLWKYFRDPMLPKDGVFTVPDTPGLGLEPDEAAIRKDAA
jgi:L-alanine-DL-glutamate epimerase-like enolase superfamily enzyme